MGCLKASMPQQYAKVEKDNLKPKKIKVVTKKCEINARVQKIAKSCETMYIFCILLNVVYQL